MTGPTHVNTAQAKDTTPARAPVSELPLPAIQKAGVYLTWGVLGMITLFVAIMLVYLWRSDPASGLPLTVSAGSAPDTVRFRLQAAEQTAFRDFWLKILQMVLLNVLLPVLTALLGYIFGTQSRAPTPEK